MMVQHLRGLSRTNLSSWNMLIIVGDEEEDGENPT